MSDRTRICRLLAVVVLATILLAGAVIPAQAVPRGQDSEPVVLVYGQTVDGELGGDQPSAFFAFDALMNDVITITMIVTQDLDPFIVLNNRRHAAGHRR